MTETKGDKPEEKQTVKAKGIDTIAAKGGGNPRTRTEGEPDTWETSEKGANARRQGERTPKNATVMS